MTVVLDSGGLTMPADKRARVEELRRRGQWPVIVPAVILAESLTGDHGRDHAENRLLRTCDVRAVDEQLCRRTAVLRTAAALRTEGSARQTPSAVDAIVVAVADDMGGASVLTGDPGSLGSLALHATNEIRLG